MLMLAQNHPYFNPRPHIDALFCNTTKLFLSFWTLYVYIIRD